MAECLVIARKLGPEESSSDHCQFASLTARPNGFPSASNVGRNVFALNSIRNIEDGPYGGTMLKEGASRIGELLSIAWPVSGLYWGAVRISDYALAQTAHALTQGSLWLPGTTIPLQLEHRALGDIGRMGLVDRDITGPPPRGPFKKEESGSTATYPSLWNHEAKRERRIICDPDSQLIVRPGMELKAEVIWSTASRTHLNRDFTFGSQALCVAFTDQVTIGGRVWPNVDFEDLRFEYTFAIWGNSTLGLLSYWWHSSRQQSSKAGMTVRSAESLPVLDFRELSDNQLATAKDIFDDFRERDMMPAFLADADPNRALLDKRVICDLLGFDQGIYEAVRRLAAKWCAEPSVHGGKKRPKGAELVI